MFWTPKPTVDLEDEDWQLDAWSWLIEGLGGLNAMKQHSLALPCYQHFPPSRQSGHAHAEFVFRQVADRFGVDASDFSLVPQDEDVDPVLGPLAIVRNAPSNPLGTYSEAEPDKHVVTYAPALLDNLEGLIATIAHEICHPILLRIPDDPPGGPEAEEFATDLAMIFFGFGVFGANSSFVFNQFSDTATGTQGWSFNRAGYLTQAEWGFGLAVRTILLGEDERRLKNFLSPGVAAHFTKNLKYLKASDEPLQRLLEEA